MHGSEIGTSCLLRSAKAVKLFLQIYVNLLSSFIYCLDLMPTQIIVKKVVY